MTHIYVCYINVFTKTNDYSIEYDIYDSDISKDKYFNSFDELFKFLEKLKNKLLS
jgi:hypothetical protein